MPIPDKNVSYKLYSGDKQNSKSPDGCNNNRTVQLFSLFD